MSDIINKDGYDEYWSSSCVLAGSDEHIESLQRELDLFDDDPDCERAMRIKRELAKIREERKGE